MKKSKKKSKQHTLVYLLFLDHSEDRRPMNEITPLYIEVAGFLLRETSDYYIIGSWITDGDLNDGENNNLFWCVLKSTIVKEKRIKL